MNRTATAMDFVHSIRSGICLGNSFDCVPKPKQLAAMQSLDGFLTAWGNPVTTTAHLQMLRDAGFDVLRFPVTWGPHLGEAPDYTIDPAWLQMVDHIVRCALDMGFRMVLNVHHDGAKISLCEERLDESEAVLCAIWRQLAEHFADIDESLVFETLNEPRIGDNWDGCPDGCAAVNRLNAAALHTIRAAGGNNSMRFVMLPTYAASPKEIAFKYMQVPEDDRVIVSVHAYFPTEYCFPNCAVTWNPPREQWGDSVDYARLTELFARIEKYFIINGIPVIIGETGAVKKSDNCNRQLWTAAYTKIAAAYGIPCFWWDEGNCNENGFGLFDRHTLNCTEPEIVAILTGKMLTPAESTQDKPKISVSC